MPRTGIPSTLIVTTTALVLAARDKQGRTGTRAIDHIDRGNIDGNSLIVLHSAFHLLTLGLIPWHYLCHVMPRNKSNKQNKIIVLQAFDPTFYFFLLYHN